MQMWKLEWFRHSKGKGRNAERTEEEDGKGALMIMQEHMPWSEQKTSEIIQKAHFE